MLVSPSSVNETDTHIFYHENLDQNDFRTTFHILNPHSSVLIGLISSEVLLCTTNPLVYLKLFDYLLAEI